METSTETGTSYLYQKTAALPKTLVNVDGIAIGSTEQIVIAGPCSVEDRSQVLDTASFLAECGVSFIRGGAFKPRTSPYSFQGLGTEGVEILYFAAKSYDLRVVTEIMEIEQIPFVAEHADLLQVGARNMQNTPLLKALAKVNKPVLLKRGFANTLSELLLSAEYLLQGGNQQIILCERGIRTFEDATRFTFDVSAIPLLQQKTHLPVIADPSHATGDGTLVPALAKSAIAAGADGVMIEIHPNPHLALSDKEQALGFNDFKKALDEMKTISHAINRILL